MVIANWDSYSFYNGTYVVNRTVPLLAKICVKIIYQFIDAGSTAKQMYVIGFSAGGQTAGFIGKGVQNLGRILGKLASFGMKINLHAPALVAVVHAHYPYSLYVGQLIAFQLAILLDNLSPFKVSILVLAATPINRHP